MEAQRKAEQPRSKRPDPFVMVIFGATGDLTRRKLVPALFCLHQEGLLPGRYAIIGYARRDLSDDAFRHELLEGVRKHCRLKPVDARAWEGFARNVFYHRGNLDDVSGYISLRRRLFGADAPLAPPWNLIFYTATPPDYFRPIVDRLRESGLNSATTTGAQRPRLIVEKPFGRDLDEARRLNAAIREAFDESSTFRIDHYLGKETVQNLLVFRFANGIFEPLWNSRHVDHVQITVAETIGVEGRARYFDQAGVIRDMVQNHMMHLLSLVAMEPPMRLDPDAIRNEKVKVLRSLRTIPPDCVRMNVVRGQYTAGKIRGEPVPGYTEEPGVAPHSRTETFAALKVWVDNWRWSGVPFYLRTGKRLAARVTDISIHFKSVPRVLFNTDPERPIEQNVIALRIQPDEGISLRFQVKAPGGRDHILPHQMDFSYARAFGQEPPEAYERLLLDAALGDATLFTRDDEIEAAWAYVTPILEGCAQAPPHALATYAAGTWGPKAADDLIAADGHTWSLLRPGK